MVELVAYDWPGNIRQLRNVATEIAARSGHLPQALIPASLHRTRKTRKRPPSGPFIPEAQVGTERAASANTQRELQVPGQTHLKPAQLTDEHILATLQAQRWNVTASAKALGIAKNSLVARMQSIAGLRQGATLTATEIATAQQEVGADVTLLAEYLHVSPRALLLRMAQLRKHSL